MYAVIKTGGKQYRVQPGDTIVVEKLDGDAGAELKFDSVLMLGGDKGVTLGAPLIDGAFVGATLVETRKGEKIKIFKKTRRQGYRRTNGHRQMESVLRITGIEGAGETAKWEGKVDLTTKAEINLRARNLAARDATSSLGSTETVVTDVDGAEVKGVVVESSAPTQDSGKKAPVKKKAAPKAEAAGDEA
ncbi:large subunit ribosomal protein L21 [Brevundimonas vesicularis]|uniref:Large ribosomal subunit protein bL21 n=1 Tax=Brevundimonas vesicularis TaxID=41276 RepID=A0A7W9FWP1_BREVE|nr:50S ribosomal protein L21 [Brevundimonas vesicularis]MBB5772923.1 large subunit ribosomal protein L21 [Brevundimonas vesicularis]